MSLKYLRMHYVPSCFSFYAQFTVQRQDRTYSGERKRSFQCTAERQFDSNKGFGLNHTYHETFTVL